MFKINIDKLNIITFKNFYLKKINKLIIEFILNRNMINLYPLYKSTKRNKKIHIPNYNLIIFLIRIILFMPHPEKESNNNTYTSNNKIRYS